MVDLLGLQFHIQDILVLRSDILIVVFGSFLQSLQIDPRGVINDMVFPLFL
jgi:hypothetical protein